MLTTNLSVTGRVITKENEVQYAGKYNVDTLQFTFNDENWAELDKTCVFELKNGTVYNTALLNDATIIPAEVYLNAKNQMVQVGVYGYEANECILDTIPIPIYIHEGVYQDGIEPENLPTMTQWNAFVQQANQILSDTEDVYDNVVSTAQQNISDMNDIKDDTEDIKDDTQTIYENTVGIKNDAQDILDDAEEVQQQIADMAQSLTFATFDVDPETGMLYMNTEVSLGNMVFSISTDGALQVTI